MGLNTLSASLKITLAVLIFAFSNLSFAQAWIEYENQADFFTINFPSEPVVEEINYSSEYGAVFPGRVYRVEDGNKTYSVTVIDYTNAEQIHANRSNSTEADAPPSYEYWRIDVFASIAFAAQKFRTRGGEVTYDAWHHIERVAGHQLNITNPDQSRSYVGIYLHKARLYIVEATVPKGYPPMGHFQQSLGFIDEKGVRIRYNWAEDDSLVRDTQPRP